jgi:phospholipid-translocating ATPase
VVADLFLALSLCHNVTPVVTEEPAESDDEQDAQGDQPQHQIEDKPKKRETRVFQASSPDEIALVKFAEQMGMRLENREELFVEIKDVNSKDEDKSMKYEILKNFPFSSETKRMGIIVKNQKDDKIMFYLKGAEVVMERKVRPDQRVSLTEACEQLAQDGLRTLVICQKNLSRDEYLAFHEKYEAARASMEDREKETLAALESIEEGMEFLAVTGVEDKLQDNVLETIEKFRAAGIQVWMLTGDKIETAKCIAIATGMNRKTESVHEIRGDQLRGDDQNQL